MKMTMIIGILTVAFTIMQSNCFAASPGSVKPHSAAKASENDKLTGGINLAYFNRI